MEHSDQNTHHEEFDANRVGYLLDSAAMAEEGGNSRLAIHLYCAAFEASQDTENGVDERALSGLRQAWVLACEQGDRSTAETIFNDLAPYNSDEQTRAALEALQEMATQQLGLKKGEMEDMAIALADEIRDAGIDIQALFERFGDVHNRSMEDKIDLSNIPAALLGSMPPHENPDALVAPEQMGAGGEFSAENIHAELRYANLCGFERTKEKMQAYGIVDPGNTELQSFLRQAESFHGVSGPVLSQNFLFVGPSREDNGIFAQATANEIGWPTITMIVDVNEFGDGTIKVVAPIKRSFFGPPRITDLPNPCTLVIQNIDILQELFWNEEHAINSGQGPFGYRHSDEHVKPQGMGKMPGVPAGVGAQGYPRSLQHEIIGYLGALFARGGVFVIGTSAMSSAEHPLVLSEQLESLLGKPVEIAVEMPNLEERQSVLSYFSTEHPSFHDLDSASLACLSEGMSRFEIFVSCRQAVEEAYSESLKNQRHQMVSLEDILTTFTRYLAQDSITYRLVEDYLVALFAADLENELLQTDVIPNQISLEFDDNGDKKDHVSED